MTKGCIASTLAICMLLPALLGRAAPSRAAEWPVWQPTSGPYAGPILDLQESADGALFAAGISGIFKSVDGGRQWQPCLTLGGDFHGTATRVLPLRSGRVLAGTNGRGIYLSSRECNGWVQLPLPQNPNPIPALAVSPSGRIFVSSWGKGLLASSDDGLTWRTLGLPGPPLVITFVTALAVTRSGSILASVRGGLWKSSDDGESWKFVAPPEVSSLQCLGDGRCFAGAHDGLWRSDDDGNNWVQIGLAGQRITTFSANARSITASTVDRSSSSAALARSIDNGATWRIETPDWPIVPAQAMIETTKGQLFAGTQHGIYQSNGNRPWTPVGITGSSVTGLYILDEKTVMARQLSSISPFRGFRSDDRGATWQPVSIHFSEWDRRNGSIGRPLSFATDSRGRLFVGSDHAVVVSADRGVSWSRTGLWHSTNSLLILPGGLLLAGTRDGIYRSVDGGEKWTEHSLGLSEYDVQQLVAVQNDEIFAATRNAVFRSRDGGLTWRSAGEGSRNRFDRPVMTVAGTDLMASNASALYQLREGRWGLVIEMPSPVLSLTSDHADRVWVGTGRGVFILRRSNSTWSSTPAGLDDDAIHALAVFPDSYVIAATKAHGVFRAEIGRGR